MTPEHEFLVRHPAPSPDFTRIGDQTGMWMLNFPFPYARPDFREQFAALSRLLAADGAGALTNYLAARRALHAALTPEDYRYFAFQL